LARMVRTIHPAASFFWRPLAEIAPDLQIAAIDPADPPMGLLMLDQDGSIEVYVFNEDGRKKLVEALTGGVILPNGAVPLQ
jgi:hypothetical protein